MKHTDVSVPCQRLPGNKILGYRFQRLTAAPSFRRVGAPANVVCFLGILLLFGWASTSTVHAQQRLSLFLNGPGVTKHFASYGWMFNSFHPGIGGEAYWHRKALTLGAHFHYMHRDSNNNASYWLGAVIGGRFRPGKPGGFWCQPSLLVGGIKKKEYNGGKLGPFALPYLAVGYKWFGLNICYIPELKNVTCPLVIVQLKIRLLDKAL